MRAKSLLSKLLSVFVACLVAPVLSAAETVVLDSGGSARRLLPPASAPTSPRPDEAAPLEVAAALPAPTAARAEPAAAASPGEAWFEFRMQLHGGGYESHQVEDWEIPEASADPVERAWPDWVFHGRGLYGEEVPPYAQHTVWPLFYIPPRSDTELALKVKKVVRRKIYREIRRRIKRSWKKTFKNDPTMTFARYDATLGKINNIGKSREEQDEFNAEYRENSTRDQVLSRNDRDGEPDIPLITWGPLTITDSGDIDFDVGSVNEEVEAIDLGEKKPKPLFATRDYKISTSLKLHIDPVDADPRGNYVPFVDAYGFEIEVDWLSDVLEREMITNEFTVEFDKRGDVAAFFNFVIKARR